MSKSVLVIDTPENCYGCPFGTEYCGNLEYDGCWGMLEAIACINLINEIMKIQFWKREKFWKENYEQQVLEEIINPIEKKLKEIKNA